MPRALKPKAPKGPSPSPRHAPQPHHYVETMTNLQAADDKYLRRSLSHLSHTHSALENALALVISPQHSGPRPPTLPPYTLRSSRLVDDVRALPSVLARAQAQSTLMAQHLNDLRSEPYPFGSAPASARSPEEVKREEEEEAAKFANGAITIEDLLKGGMEGFERRVAAMGPGAREDALLTLRLHAAGAENRLEAKTKRLLELAEAEAEVERRERAGAEAEEGRRERPAFVRRGDTKVLRLGGGVMGSEGERKGWGLEKEQAMAKEREKLKVTGAGAKKKAMTGLERKQRRAREREAKRAGEKKSGEKAEDSSGEEAKKGGQGWSLWDMQKRLESTMFGSKSSKK